MLMNPDGALQDDSAHKDFHNRIKKNMTQGEYDAIMKALAIEFDKAAAKNENRCVVSSWVPGSDWTGTVYEPIYNACDKEEYPTESAKYMFGNMVWRAAIAHRETWIFVKPPKDDDGPLGIKYFLPDR